MKHLILVQPLGITHSLDTCTSRAQAWEAILRCRENDSRHPSHTASLKRCPRTVNTNAQPPARPARHSGLSASDPNRHGKGMPTSHVWNLPRNKLHSAPWLWEQ